MPEENTNIDDFNFDDFLSDDTKKELDIVEDKGFQATDVPVESSTTQTEVVEQPVVTPDTTVQETAPVVTTESDSDAPVRAPNEPDWKYNYRLEIYSKQQELKTASNDVEKKEIKDEIKNIRKNLAETSSQNTEERADEADIFGDLDPELIQNDVKYIKKIGKDAGYVRQEDLPALLREMQRAEQEIAAVDSAESKFLSRHPEYSDPTKYNAFVKFVGENFILSGKSEAAVQNALETAHSWLNPKTFEEKVAAAQNLDKTMEAVDFSGSSKSESYSPEKEEASNLVKAIKSDSGNDWSWAVD